MQADPGTANAVAEGMAEQARVFSSAGIDGLILWALVLSTFLLFLALCWALWMLRSKDRECAAQSKAFAEAAVVQADANKQLATAIASSHAADMGFKQAMFATYPDLEAKMKAVEAARKPNP